MARQVAAVTGATSGIGLYIARGLAASGHDVVIVARNKEKAEAARAAVTSAASGQPRVSIEMADLASLASVEDLALRLGDRYPDLSLLINNAGVLMSRKTLSADGIEMDLAVNHVAPFLLTWRLLPLLRRNGGTRVVNVNSGAHERPKLAAADLEPNAPFRIGAYGKSKLANMASVVEMASRVPAQEVTINAVHPGVVATNLFHFGWATPLLSLLSRPFMLSPERGAETPLWAATTPALAGVTGGYYKKKAAAPMNPQAQDPGIRVMVWKRTVELARVDERELPTAITER
jgi:retinol dehydrogenase-12